jgi:hypothetical protein
MTITDVGSGRLDVRVDLPDLPEGPEAPHAEQGDRTEPVV